MMRIFDQTEAYLAGDTIFGLVCGGHLDLDGTEEQLFDAMAEEFADSWIDFSNELGAEDADFNLQSLFTSLQDGWEDDNSDDTPVTRDEISDTGTHEVRNDVDVWVYQGEDAGKELVLEVNHDAPKIITISDDELTMTFSDWGETGSPERPEDSQIIGEDGLEQRMMELFLSGTAG